MGLTVLEVKTSKSKGKTLKLSDGGGMYLMVNPSGAKYWRLSYRFMGKQKTLALGVYPLISLQEARLARDRAKKQLSEGEDPCELRKSSKSNQALIAINNFKTIADEWFIKQSHTWVKSHATDVRRRLEANLYPVLGSLSISNIEPIDVLKTVQIIEKRGSYDLAHRVLGVCGQVFRYAVSCGICKSDPTRDLKGALTPHVKKNQNAVKPEEFSDLMKSIENYEKIGDELTKLALQLLALTFVRTAELIGAEWEEFDFENAIWRIPASRMKMKREHLVPLSQQALTILKKLRTMSECSKFVFVGRNSLKHISNNTLLFALYRLGYKNKMTGHGFRAVASTILNENEFRSDVIERQLAHIEKNEVRGAYNRAEYIKERVTMMNWWGNFIDSL